MTNTNMMLMQQNESRTAKNANNKNDLIGGNLSQNLLNQVNAVAVNSSHGQPLGNFPLSAKNQSAQSALGHHNSFQGTASKERN